MKFPVKTLAVIAPIGLGVCLLLTSVGMSQEARKVTRIPIQPNLPILKQPGVTNVPNVQPELLMTPQEKIEKRIADLEAKVAQQEKTIAELNQQVNARPAGYTKAFINLGSFRRLPDTEGITYWARIK